MLHAPEWHLLDCSFPQADAGLALPHRNLTAGAAKLQIQNLDRNDPPDYKAGGTCRGSFNGNVLKIASGACMPAIPVICSVSGFDPKTNPILWRLICRHVLCRYCNSGDYRYGAASDTFEREWRGESRSASFNLFGTDSPECSCTYGDSSHVMGGHGILQCAVVIGGTLLSDFVHVRIVGSNPTQSDVLNYLTGELADSDPNVACMVRAIFAHESGYRQFSIDTQSKTLMNFSYRRGFHRDPAQPDCPVTFSWPADPPDFPLVTFDYGVGISQYTRVAGQSITSDMAWDWRENIRAGINLFLSHKLKPTFRSGMTWRDWASHAWAAYNGSGAAAEQYARTLAAGPDGLRVSAGPVQAGFEVAILKAPLPLPTPDPWLQDAEATSA